jgi:hypothetical protein
MRLRNIDILAAENVLANAKVALADTIKSVQAVCTHETVGETAGQIDTEGTIIRVCLDCGLGVASRRENYGVLGGGDRLVYKLTHTQAVALRRN